MFMNEHKLIGSKSRPIGPLKQIKLSINNKLKEEERNFDMSLLSREVNFNEKQIYYIFEMTPDICQRRRPSPASHASWLGRKVV